MGNIMPGQQERLKGKQCVSYQFKLSNLGFRTGSGALSKKAQDFHERVIILLMCHVKLSALFNHSYFRI